MLSISMLMKIHSLIPPRLTSYIFKIVYQQRCINYLKDVLENDGYKLDIVFKLSFMMDMASGMQYLQSSTIGSHGNLKDSNCLIDGRWVLKVNFRTLANFAIGKCDKFGSSSLYNNIVPSSKSVFVNY
jgi:hypothetical protein